MVKFGEPMRVDGGKCYVVVIRFHAADLSNDARRHGIDFSVDLNTPTLTAQSDTMTFESENHEIQC